MSKIFHFKDFHDSVESESLEIVVHFVLWIVGT